MGRIIAAKFEVQWNGTDWIDESAYLHEATGSVKLAPAASSLFASRGTADSLSVTLFDADRRFNPLKSSGALYGSLSGGGAYHREARLSVQVDGGAWVRIFTGVLKLPKETSPGANEAGLITFAVRSMEERLLNSRQSTDIDEMFVLQNQDEGTIIEYLLDAAGVSTLDIQCDSGLFRIPYTWMDEESLIDELWQIAAACGGRFYVDIDGQFCYENASHWLTGSRHTSSQQTYTTDDYKRLNILLEDADLFSDVTVVTASRFAGPVGRVWAPDSPVIVPANSTKVVTAAFRQPLACVEGTLTYSLVTHGGVRVSSGVSVGTNWYAQRAIITIVNSNAFAVVLQQASITGPQLVGGNQHEEVFESAHSFWTGRKRRARRFTGNAYIQLAEQAATLAQMGGEWSQTPRLQYQLLNAIGNPERRLGDLVTISNPIMFPDGSRTGFITGLSFKLDAAGFTHTSIDCIDASTIYPYATSPGYFVIGTSLLNGTHKVFY